MKYCLKYFVLQTLIFEMYNTCRYVNYWSSIGTVSIFLLQYTCFLMYVLCCVVFLGLHLQFWYSWRYQLKAFSDEYRVVAVDMR